MKAMFALFAVLVAAYSQPVAAEQVAKFGDIEIHYNAMLTSELNADVAKSYKIDRSSNRGLLTVAALKKNKLGVAEPVAAKISASAVNLNSQLSNIDMREIKEGQAIYYLGDFRLSAPETLKFNLNVTPQGGKTRTVDFQQAFYR